MFRQTNLKARGRSESEKGFDAMEAWIQRERLVRRAVKDLSIQKPNSYLARRMISAATGLKSCIVQDLTRRLP